MGDHVSAAINDIVDIDNSDVDDSIVVEDDAEDDNRLVLSISASERREIEGVGGVG